MWYQSSGGGMLMIENLQDPCDTLTVVQSVAPSKAYVFSICWGTGLPANCGLSGDNPALLPVVKAGSTIGIKSDLYNMGSPGRIMVIFKINDVAAYNETNVSLGTYPAIWSPIYSGYKMPNVDVKITIEGYGWDGTNWKLDSTRTMTISHSTPICTGTTISPVGGAIIAGPGGVDATGKAIPGGTVKITVTVDPKDVSLPVEFKDRAGTVLSSCNTTAGTGQCSFTWDSNILGKTPGTYYVKAYSGSCVSTEVSITVSAPILQRDFGITVNDSVTGWAVSGATILVTTIGGVSQSKVTDSSGLVTFRVDVGTVNIAISKNGYNTSNEVQSIYSDTTITYYIIPIPPTPTTGSIQIVTVPTGVSIYLDGKATAEANPTPAVIGNLIAGDHTFILKLSGYEDLTGTVTVPSGGSVNVYRTLTKITPGTGSLNITSRPLGADVWVDGKDTGLTTSGMTVIDSIPPGTHSYTLTMTGFQDKTGTFVVKAGETTSLDVELVHLVTIGTLEIDSEPSGARVYIDEKDSLRSTPATIGNLTAGDHKYKVVLESYKDISGIFTIKSGETETVHLILEKSGIGVAGWLGAAAAGVVILGFIIGRREKEKESE